MHGSISRFQTGLPCAICSRATASANFCLALLGPANSANPAGADWEDPLDRQGGEEFFCGDCRKFCSADADYPFNFKIYTLSHIIVILCVVSFISKLYGLCRPTASLLCQTAVLRVMSRPCAMRSCRPTRGLFGRDVEESDDSLFSVLSISK